MPQGRRIAQHCGLWSAGALPRRPFRPKWVWILGLRFGQGIPSPIKVWLSWEPAGSGTVKAQGRQVSPHENRSLGPFVVCNRSTFSASPTASTETIIMGTYQGVYHSSV